MMWFMARVQASLAIPAASSDEVWKLVTDWPAHSRWIALTTVTIDADSPAASGLGTRFTGRTQLGRVGFDDPMQVTHWQPPTANVSGRCRLVKLGRWVTGWAEINVDAEAGASRLTWIEDLRPRWTPRFADPLVRLVGSALFGRTIRKLAAELETRPAG
jgi:hypothetical protein